MLTYALKVCMSLIQQRTFRNKVLRVLVELYLGLAAPDYISVCQVHVYICQYMFIGDFQVHVNAPTSVFPRYRR